MILPVQKFQQTLQSFAVSLLLCAMLVMPAVLQARLIIGIPNTPTVVNAYYPVSNIAGTVITEGVGTGIAHTLAVSDRVLLVQMTGSVGVDGGKFEFTEVTVVSGNDITVNLLTRTYTFATEAVQLVCVPYDPVSVTTQANILDKAWDGTTGGIVSVLTVEQQAAEPGHSETTLLHTETASGHIPPVPRQSRPKNTFQTIDGQLVIKKSRAPAR